MLTLEYVKGYLRVDFNEDDEFINNLLYTAEAYLYDFTDKVFENSELYNDLFLESGVFANIYNKLEEKKAITYMLAMVNELYEKRELSAEKATKTHLIYQSLLNSIRTRW